MKRTTTHLTRRLFSAALLFGVATGAALNTSSAQAEVTSLCAEVKIEIKQEASFERQAFDAELKIKNGSPYDSITDLKVEVQFWDKSGAEVLASSDPNNTDAKFFIRVDDLGGVSNVDGSGSIAPSVEATMRWLIIPAPGAAGESLQGALYSVGAKVSYKLGGESKFMNIAPDTIVVKPQPKLQLDYFLTREVYGDDAFTPAIEPVEPFPLGVRVRNIGYGAANSFKIESAQPKIIENKQGLLVDFQIIDSSVQDAPTEPTLLIPFGNVEPQSAKMGFWNMTATLSGTFQDMTAKFTHADTLGGAMTSLLDQVKIHSLVRAIRADAFGRDTIRDFLAEDGTSYRIFESDGSDTEVLGASDGATLNVSGTDSYSLRFSPGAGFAYAKVPAPSLERKVLTKAVRSDGKTLLSENAWISRTREKNDKTKWNYFLNVFDQGGTGEYTISITNENLGPVAPDMQFLPNRTRVEGEHVGFLVEASDRNGTIPKLTSSALPAGATFVDGGQGVGEFHWTSKAGQAGKYPITFTASDGTLSTSKTMTVTILPAGDSDADGMPDAWEMEKFGNLDRDGKGDFDGDGISDLDEYRNGTDPKVGSASVPMPPRVASPTIESTVADLRPALSITNGAHLPENPVQYDFEIYTNANYLNPVAKAIGVAEGTDTTTWRPDQPLLANQNYYWRARAKTGSNYSAWVYGRFFLSGQGLAPYGVRTAYPLAGASVGSVTPTLQVSNAVDPAGLPLTYEFLVWSDEAKENLVASRSVIAPNAAGVTAWVVDKQLTAGSTYYWQAKARNSKGQKIETEISSFRVDTFNKTPSSPLLKSPAVGANLRTLTTTLATAVATDPEGDAVKYLFELDTSSTFSSAARKVSPVLSTPSWPLSGLSNNTRYFWRAKAFDATSETPWTVGNFFVKQTTSGPVAPVLGNPGDGSQVHTLTPAFWTLPSQSGDGDAVSSYELALYTDEALTSLVKTVTLTHTKGFTLDVPLTNKKFYFWRARAKDSAGHLSAWSTPAKFFVNTLAEPQLPTFEFHAPAANRWIFAGAKVPVLFADEDVDSNAKINFYYTAGTEMSGGKLITTTALNENEENEADQFVWSVPTLTAGQYRIYAELSDGTNTVQKMLPVVFTGSPYKAFYDYCIDPAATAAIKTTVLAVKAALGVTDCLDAQEKLPTVTALSLSGKGIVDLSPLASLTWLTSLNLADNAIVNLAPLATLTLLDTLNLSNNKVTTLTSIANLQSLVTFNGERNPIGTTTASCPSSARAPGIASFCNSYLAATPKLVLRTGSGSTSQTLQPGYNLAPILLGIQSGTSAAIIEKSTDTCGFLNFDGNTLSGSVPFNIAPTVCRLTFRVVDGWRTSTSLTVTLTIRPIAAFLAMCQDSSTGAEARSTINAVLAKVASSDCETGFKSLVNLTKLDLTGLSLVASEPLAGLEKLKELAANGNRFSSATAFGTLINLTTLRLKDSGLTTLTPLGALKYDTILEALGNPIEKTETACPIASLNKALNKFCATYLMP